MVNKAQNNSRKTWIAINTTLNNSPKNPRDNEIVNLLVGDRKVVSSEKIVNEINNLSGNCWKTRGKYR